MIHDLLIFSAGVIVGVLGLLVYLYIVSRILKASE